MAGRMAPIDDRPSGLLECTCCVAEVTHQRRSSACRLEVFVAGECQIGSGVNSPLSRRPPCEPQAVLRLRTMRGESECHPPDW